MYTNQNKNGKILNILLGIIAIVFIIFIIFWLVNKGNNSTANEAEFTNNLKTMQDNAKEYFATDLPENIGDTKIIYLDEMYKLGLSSKLSYGKINCDESLSYISVTRSSKDEYKVKSNLVCGSKSDNLIEKITSKTVVEEDDGTLINDDENDNINLDIDDVTSSDGKKADVVNCSGPVCGFVQIPTTCKTTYEYQHVKANISCPSGYIMNNGLCVRTTSESVPATPKYSEEQTKVTNAILNPGTSYKVYITPIIQGGYQTKTCSQGTLINGYCYEYAARQTETITYCPAGYTQNGNACYKYTDIITTEDSTCPAGYVKNNNACYKYADLVTTDETTCPSGYTKSNGACYKYANLITDGSTTYSCPSGYTKSGSGSSTKCTKTVAATKLYNPWGNPSSTYSTTTKESVYTYEYEKKVLLGSNKIGVTITYTYAIYKRTSYYNCSSGTVSGSNCLISANPIVDSSSTTRCPSGYTRNGNTCYIKTDLITTGTSYCPTGYTRSGNTCYIKTDLIVSGTSYCPTGYTRNGNTCYMKTDLVSTTRVTCPTGYTDNGTMCVRTTNPTITTTPITYSCPSGYTKSGTGASTTCYKWMTTDGKYYCENASATLKDKLCYIKVPSEFLGYECPSSYTLSDNLCYRTSTETTPPTWSAGEYIYSSEEYVEGYKRTGAAKFVMKCTKVEQPIYK